MSEAGHANAAAVGSRSEPKGRERAGGSNPGQNAPALVVREGASFEGLLTCPNSARVDGHFAGDIVGEDRIELGIAADVTGRIEARDIVIAGRFEGELSASRSIELLATARVEGELCARELIAEEGCTVMGRCRTLPRD